MANTNLIEFQEIFNFNNNNELSNTCILFPNLELAIVLTDDSINVKEKRILHCKLYTVKSAQVIPFRPRLFKWRNIVLSSTSNVDAPSRSHLWRSRRGAVTSPEVASPEMTSPEITSPEVALPVMPSPEVVNRKWPKQYSGKHSNVPAKKYKLGYLSFTIPLNIFLFLTKKK